MFRAPADPAKTFWLICFSFVGTQIDWAFATSPQSGLNGRQITYNRESSCLARLPWLIVQGEDVSAGVVPSMGWRTPEDPQ